MILSQRIARMLEEMLEEAGGELSIVRNELATRIGCVPSQINYVITSRFTPERGYLVESRRGGGGYIRIRRVEMSRREYLMEFYKAISSQMDQNGARYFLTELVNRSFLSLREANLIYSALTDGALSTVAPSDRAVVRAGILKQVILQMLSESEG